MLSWVLAHEQVAFFNRRYGTRHVTKPLLLHLARSAGIAIPRTLVTNEMERLDETQADQWIAKPVNGGEYTRVLASGSADDVCLRRFFSEPTIVQRRLIGPDLRVYRVGNRWFAFTVESEAIDYRIMHCRHKHMPVLPRWMQGRRAFVESVFSAMNRIYGKARTRCHSLRR